MYNIKINIYKINICQCTYIYIYYQLHIQIDVYILNTCIQTRTKMEWLTEILKHVSHHLRWHDAHTFLQFTHQTHRIHVWYIWLAIYHQYTPNVSIYTIHGSYGKGLVKLFKLRANCVHRREKCRSYNVDGPLLRGAWGGWGGFGYSELSKFSNHVATWQWGLRV